MRRVGLLLAIPLASLLALWAFSAASTLSAALQRSDFSSLYSAIGLPANAVTVTIQEERAAASAVIASRSSANLQKLQTQVAKTDAAVAAFRKSALSSKSQGLMSATLRARVRAVSTEFEALGPLRSRVEAGTTTPVPAIEGYSEISDTTIRMLTTLVGVDDISVYRQTVGVLEIYWARDFMLREDALMSATRGRMTASNRAAFARWAGNREEFFELGRVGLTGDIARVVQEIADAPAYTRFNSLENAVVHQGVVPDARGWNTVMAALSPQWLRASVQAGHVLNSKLVEPAGRAIMLRFYLAGGVGLLAVAASVVLSLVFARRLAAELGALQRTAQELAHERLPRVVARLRRGETVDVVAEAPLPVVGRTREIALVSDAFATVQRTAVGTAVGEAELRASINQVFVNLSWRSQSLLHRQLRLLDQMERRASSPEELDDLFRLDHLTTRMRRHAEGLVILSGAPTMRAWDSPIAAEDVVRAAIAEVEDYTRVEVTGASSSAITGAVVADVIHLLAELIENAAAFSPPTTEVTVKVETVGQGLVVEVVDRGVGLALDELDELNRRLAEAVEFDLVDTERLGLFVVARLATRHGIKVSLQASAYGGTTAVVLIPHALVTQDGEWRSLNEQVSTPHTVGSPASARGAGPRLNRPVRMELPSPPRHARPEEPPPAPPGSFADRLEFVGEDVGGLEAELSDGTGGLPRRVRQRNLAPQLRNRPSHSQPAIPGDGGENGEAFDEPSPEFSRDLMSSLQAGWLRGRGAGERADDSVEHEE
ncbi:nitrate- and nitrite sensing domain-containing protein [Actinomadura sp. NPDC048394]|jgi:signal transduction histidine kinase|uniref:sensor histidine kinase n=1 Tax=Actinomadura sp. NPDC048394 TaxID=3158223 RepID=UPI00340179A6